MARYSINPNTEVYHESGANEMHRLSRKPPSDVALIENFPLIFNDPKTKPCTRRVQEYEQGPGFVKIRNVVSDHVVKFIRATFELDATSLFARSRTSESALLTLFHELGSADEQWKKAIFEIPRTRVIMLRFSAQFKRRS